MKNNIYTIEAHLPFADTLAGWLLAEYGLEPHVLAGLLVLLPSRRACLSLRESFLRATAGKPLLLPRIQPLGEIPEELRLAAPLGDAPLMDAPPSPAFEHKRLFMLAQLINRQRKAELGHEIRMDNALRLAKELAHLLDELEREEITLGDLQRLVPDMFAAHWQVTVEFLKILSEHWPLIAREAGMVSPASYRNNTLRGLADAWKASPPSYPVIAAGTTGSIPVTAHLLKVISELPQGRIVLPGLDSGADDAYFSHIHESHPQWGMQHLLAAIGVERQAVKRIGDEGNDRVRLLSEIMRPPETSDAWQHITIPMEKALAGMKYITCGHVQEEATAIALLLRETLETPAKTAALVTHDRALARRVAALMQQFGVTVDDSAGLPLNQTPAASFLRLVLDVAASDYASVPLLSLLKHPLAHVGMERIECLEAARSIEILCLRGVRVHGGIAGLREALSLHPDATADLSQLLANLENSFLSLTALFASAKETAFTGLINAHLQCAESLAGQALWRNEKAETLTDFLSEVSEASASGALPHVMPAIYPAIFETLLAGKVYRPEYGMHPRLKILSPIESRMQSFDRIILGGLNEGSWPPAIEGDPWFNRPMRHVIGLPVPERRIGLAAHDFFMLAATPEVYLTRAEKTDGVPTTPARWLVKLDTLLIRFGATHMLESAQWQHWAQSLSIPQSLMPCSAPAPKPPVNARPREMSVTDVETWMRDPYALYAKKILRLKPLDPLGQDPTGAHFGNAVHQALETFVRAHPIQLPKDAYEKLLQAGREALQPLFFNSVVEALWWPRFKHIAAFVIEQEKLRRPDIRRIFTEVDGAYMIGNFKLKGRADRIEESQDGSLAIIDYKTGSLPATKDIEEGLSSQLVLLALIAADGAMEVRGPAHSLEYWKLRGGDVKGEIKYINEDRINALIEAADKGLKALIATYNNAAMPYLSTPIPARERRFKDYDHLARVKEWS